MNQTWGVGQFTAQLHQSCALLLYFSGVKRLLEGVEPCGAIVARVRSAAPGGSLDEPPVSNLSFTRIPTEGTRQAVAAGGS
jgi:hypothetical protein